MLPAMCGRYMSPDQASIERHWHIGRHNSNPFQRRYNVAPTQTVPALRRVSGELELTGLRWGLVPFWAKGVPPRYSTINARMEGMAKAPSYRGPWKHGQRCILPAGGFYEWQVVGSRKQPWFIHLLDQEVFGLAGLWDRSESPEGGLVESCTIITLPANPLLARIHNGRERMPAILRREDHQAWLAGSPDDALACLAPYPQAQMAAHTVSTVVNSPRNDGPDLIAPAPPLAAEG